MNLLEAYKCNKYMYITNAITVQLDIIGSKYTAEWETLICTISTSSRSLQTVDWWTEYELFVSNKHFKVRKLKSIDNYASKIWPGRQSKEQI